MKRDIQKDHGANVVEQVDPRLAAVETAMVEMRRELRRQGALLEIGRGGRGPGDCLTEPDTGRSIIVQVSTNLGGESGGPGRHRITVQLEDASHPRSAWTWLH